MSEKTIEAVFWFPHCGCEGMWKDGEKQPVYTARCPSHALSAERAKEVLGARGALERALPWNEFKELRRDVERAKTTSFEGIDEVKQLKGSGANLDDVDTTLDISFASLNEMACHTAEFLAKLAPVYERED
jgi:hypothetical protein